MLIVNTGLALTELRFLQDVGECLPHRTVNVEGSSGSQFKEVDLVKES